MKHSKTVCKNTLFVANVYLLSYIPNNVNALIMLVVYYFLNYIPQFFHIPRSAPMGGLRPPNPSGLGLYPSIPKPRGRVVVLRVPRTRNTTRCGWQHSKSVALAMLYCNVVLNRYII